MACLGPPPFLTPQIPPKKIYVGPFLRSFPGKLGVQTFFWGPKMGGGFELGAKKMLKKVSVLFLSFLVHALKR